MEKTNFRLLEGVIYAQTLHYSCPFTHARVIGPKYPVAWMPTDA